MPSTGITKSKKKQTAENDCAKKDATHQSTPFSGDGFKKKSKYAAYIGTGILLMDEIYRETSPRDIKRQYFHYIITEFVEQNQKFTLKYKNQVIDPAKTVLFFYVFQEDDLEPMTGVKLETIENGCNRFLGVNAKLRAAEFENNTSNQTKIR